MFAAHPARCPARTGGGPMNRPSDTFAAERAASLRLDSADRLRTPMSIMGMHALVCYRLDGAEDERRNAAGGGA